MSEWVKSTLSKVVALKRGHDLPASQRRPGDVPVLGSFGITGWHDVMKASGPGVTIGRSGASIGTASYVYGDYWPLNTCLYVTDFKGNDPRWVFHMLDRIDFAGHNSGSAQPSLNRNFLAQIPVYVPPLEEQRRIASVLGAFDDLIETNRGMARNLENAVSAQFAAAGFDRTPMGASIPLGELIEVNPKLPKPSGEAPYINMAALPTDSSRITSIERRPAAGGARFQNGDSLLARVTPCLENGKAAHVDVLTDGEVAVGSTEFLVLRDRGEVGSHWAYILSRSTRFRDYAMRHMSGSSGRQRCSADSIEQYPIDPPSPERLKAFRSFAEPAFRSIREIHEENDQLTRTRDELLPLLMSGKVRVEDVEIPKGAA